MTAIVSAHSDNMHLSDTVKKVCVQEQQPLLAAIQLAKQ